MVSQNTQALLRKVTEISALDLATLPTHYIRMLAIQRYKYSYNNDY